MLATSVPSNLGTVYVRVWWGISAFIFIAKDQLRLECVKKKYLSKTSTLKI